MKIQCNACEKAEATVLCCADEAALCGACDEKVHAANKLASKHQRVPLSNSSSHMPKCDICQETTGYFFCLEDRALFCRKCDVAIHTANSYVSGHQRFLLTGVKVGLESTGPVVSSSNKSNSTDKFTEAPSRSLSRRGTSVSLSGDNNEVLSRQTVFGGSAARSVSFSSTIPGTIPEWPLEEFLGMTGFGQSYGFMGHGSSKADSSKLGDSEWSPLYRSVSDEDVDNGECLGQVPEIPWTVPEIRSPPTASGLNWPTNAQDDLLADKSMFVPDVSSFPNLHHPQPNPFSKRRRHAQEIGQVSWV